MPSEPPPTRRLAVALTAAVASTTIAVGVTAASLLGWWRPTAPASEVMPAAPATPAPSGDLRTGDAGHSRGAGTRTARGRWRLRRECPARGA